MVVRTTLMYRLIRICKSSVMPRCRKNFRSNQSWEEYRPVIFRKLVVAPVKLATKEENTNKAKSNTPMAKLLSRVLVG